MIRSRNAHRALLLFVVALAFAALITNVVGAEPGAKWTIEKGNGTLVDAATLNAAVGIREIEKLEASEEQDGSISGKLVGLAVQIKCTGVSLINASLEGEGRVSEGFKVKFTGCSTMLNGKMEKECTPQAESESGVILTNELKGSIVLQAGVGIVVVEAKEKETLTFIKTNEECPIGPKISVVGRFAVSVASMPTRLVEHLVSQDPFTEIWFVSKTTEHVASIKGSAWARLIHEHEGLRWSGDPA